MEKMDQELKERWCVSLRSGEYAQGKGMLYDPTDNSYCCLGVLGRIQGRGSDMDYNAYLRSEHGFGVPLSMDAQEKLSHMNDNQRLSFTEIADWIEKEL